MKIKIIGLGMLGTQVWLAARERGIEFDIKQPRLEEVETWHLEGCSVVINCAGIVKQRIASDSRFMLVNAYGPHRLAETCDQIGARLIHVSTDCVFDGSMGPHSEDDLATGQDIYALSKRAGEVTRAPHLTVRTSFIGYGERGLLASLQRDMSVTASRNALWTGHTAPTVAGLLLDLSERDDITGILHIPGEMQTRPELLSVLSLHFGFNLYIVSTDDPAMDRRLVSRRWSALGLSNPPPFKEQLESL